MDWIVEWLISSPGVCWLTQADHWWRWQCRDMTGKPPPDLSPVSILHWPGMTEKHIYI